MTRTLINLPNLFTALAICLIALVICLANAGEGRADAAAAPLRVAAIHARSGIASYTDRLSFRGVALAVRLINKSGGLLGRPVSLLELDTRSTPLGARRAAEAAIAADAIAVIGATWSSHSLAIAPLLQSAGIPMISPTSSHPEVTRAGDCIFRVCFVDTFQGEMMARFARQDLSAERAAVLTNVSGRYGIDLSAFFEKAFERMGGRIVSVGKYKEKDLDFEQILAPVAALKPDVVFIPGYTRDSGLIIRQAASMGIKAHFLGGDGWTNQMYEFGGDAIDGAYYCGNWAVEAAGSKADALVAAYARVYGLVEGERVIAGLTYDATLLLADAIRRAGVADRAAIRNALAATREFDGVTGRISFNANGDLARQSAVIFQFIDGSSRFVKQMGPFEWP